MVVNKNYSVGEQAFRILESQSWDLYQHNGVKSSLVVDALRWQFDPTKEQEALDSCLNEYNLPEDVRKAFDYQRGQTKQLTVTLPEELDDTLCSEARRIYGNKKVGKYLSYIVYEFYIVRHRKARLLLEDVDPESQAEYRDLLRDNYTAEFDMDELPDGFEVAKTPHQFAPLVFVSLRNSTNGLIPDILVEDHTEFILNEYAPEVSDKTEQRYVDKVKEELNEVVNLYKLSVGGDYYLPEDESARTAISEKVDEWVDILEVIITKHNESENPLDEIRGSDYQGFEESVKAIRSEYSGWIDAEVMARVDDVFSELEVLKDEGKIDVWS